LCCRASLRRSPLFVFFHVWLCAFAPLLSSCISIPMKTIRWEMAPVSFKPIVRCSRSHFRVPLFSPSFCRSLASPAAVRDHRLRIRPHRSTACGRHGSCASAAGSRVVGFVCADRRAAAVVDRRPQRTDVHHSGSQSAGCGAAIALDHGADRFGPQTVSSQCSTTSEQRPRCCRHDCRCSGDCVLSARVVVVVSTRQCQRCSARRCCPHAQCRWSAGDQEAPLHHRRRGVSCQRRQNRAGSDAARAAQYSGGQRHHRWCDGR
jgi:hypothetical protein